MCLGLGIAHNPHHNGLPFLSHTLSTLSGPGYWSFLYIYIDVTGLTLHSNGTKNTGYNLCRLLALQ